MRALMRVVLVSIGLAIVAACDPTYAIVIDNRSPTEVVVARLVSVGDGDETWDVVSAPVGTRVTLGANGVASVGQLRRVLVMSESCNLLADETLPSEFAEGGTIIVHPDSSVALVGGGNPPEGSKASPEVRCMEVFDSL